eukprot:CAMPEP_0116127076 /NCGR_PEP_ID=MMETSP0329-20121206/6655_1 /TAXON_ID=697910 /ORGANISM="Pseudo-nitzschia arenysensis, Strain B593" /LENGTH=406 /DNA_ID=CAMNT_0003621167 /DNA_START=274 /DNA_END=1494 /DNA_ORIENTATION=+
MARDEVDRLIADISRAIQRSDLLSLLHPSPMRRRKCLSEIPKSTLDERVMPIRAALENINAQELLGLELLPNKTTTGPRVSEGVYCHPICDQIKQKWYVNDDDNDVSMGDDDDDDNNRSSIVRYLHIAEAPDEYTIGIFVFGPHERIPLHDHPEMCVLSRVLYGDLQRFSLDLDRKVRTPNDENFGMGNMIIDDDDGGHQQEEDPNEASFSSIRNFLGNQSSNLNDNNNSASSFLSVAFSRSATWFHQNLLNGSSSSGITMESATDDYPEGTKIAYRNAMDHLQAPSVASLYPYEGNLHEFVAGPYGAAVLDVLLPPYDDECKRDCTFYNIRELPVNRPSKRGRMRGAGYSPRMRRTRRDETQQQPQQPQREPCLIIPTGQPENFHCISGRYKDLGEIDDYQYDDD